MKYQVLILDELHDQFLNVEVETSMEPDLRQDGSLWFYGLPENLIVAAYAPGVWRSLDLLDKEEEKEDA